MTDSPNPSAIIEQFPCAQCGASLRYDPGADAIACPHCGHANTVAQTAPGPWGGKDEIAELDYHDALRNRLSAEEMEETRTAHCDACGASVEFDAATHARDCPFCASPIVADTGPNRHIKPKGVLPFLLTERQAREAMNGWLGSLWFAPSGLKDYARAGRPMQGIYVPYWTYDADTRTRYSGQRGDTYYVKQRVTITVDGKPKTETRSVPKIRWTRKSGRVKRFFDDIVVLASRSLPKRYADRLGPWDLSAMEPYNSQYLAGFRAEAYTVELDEGYAEAQEVMRQTIVRDIKFDIGGDHQRIDSMDTNISDVTFKHIMLPVWMAAYKYSGKTYRFIVNGRTGAVQGERPWSTVKIVIAVLLGLIAAAIVGYFFAMQSR